MDKKYLASRIATANDAGLVAILYEGLMDEIKEAIVCIDNQNKASFEKAIEKGKNILAELVITLKGDSEISKNLRSLYIYVNHLITLGQLNREKKKLQEAIHVLMPLYDGWKQLEQHEFEKREKSSRPQIMTGATYGKGQLNDYVMNHENQWGRG
ncbi:flagellar export chaperone FliS [Crassaminicella profunda]|uniref:flagellar export chaperone FliS n=1 Tax=Crassaminicella profunda TaxID=1286698 RepID=UPI001CA74FF5|nr:flagellar export chaperone FliS [Crassaminicella profunda]QZY54293.1 flagellar export chaperone FliS [Crassaminicella profunda]